MRKPELVVRLCKRVINAGIKAHYALMDTWFYSDSLIASLKEISLHSICMIKSNIRFSFEGENIRYSQKRLLSIIGRRYNSHSDIISSVIVETAQKQKVKLVFVRNRHKPDEFITILCTDINLKPELIIELYSRRWSIECCFKAAKQFLGLNSECFGHDFDTITSLNRVAYIRFTILEFIRRHRDDPRSHGQIFRESCDEIRTISWIDALETLTKCFRSLIDILNEKGCIVKGKLTVAYTIADEIIEKWYGAVSSFIQEIMTKNHISLLLKK